MTAMRDRNESSLPEWVGDALREPVTSHASSRARIMDAVRGLPTPRRMSAPMRPSRWLRRGLLSPVGSLLATAAMALVMVTRATTGTGVSDLVTVTRILGDSIVPVGASATKGHWLDTLRIVEFVIRGSGVHTATVIGDFNQWRRGATQLASVGDDEWRARVLVPRDALQMAYLVNDAQVIPAEPLARTTTSSTRATSPAW